MKHITNQIGALALLYMAEGVGDMGGFISLQDLAEMNTDEIKVLLSRVATPGVFRVRGKSVAGKQGEVGEDGRPPITRFNFSLEILDGKPADKSVDMETLIGKNINQSYALYPSDLAEGIGLLKGMYQKVGLPYSGMALGGVEGKEPGWLDGIVNHEFDIRVRNAPDKTGQMRAYFDWLPVKDEAKTNEGA